MFRPLPDHHQGVSRALRARLKAVAMRTGCFQKLLIFLTLQLSSGDWLALKGVEEGERARWVFLWADLFKVSVLATRQSWWWPGGGAAGQPAEVGVLILYELRGRRVTVESQNGCLAGYVNQKCVLVTGLTGVLGAGPTGGLYMCKYVPERKIIVIF
jgi:hypothetical protein